MVDNYTYEYSYRHPDVRWQLITLHYTPTSLENNDKASLFHPLKNRKQEQTGGIIIIYLGPFSSCLGGDETETAEVGIRLPRLIVFLRGVR